MILGLCGWIITLLKSIQVNINKRFEKIVFGSNDMPMPYYRLPNWWKVFASQWKFKAFALV